MSRAVAVNPKCRRIFIVVVAVLSLQSIRVWSAPFAYITHPNGDQITVIDIAVDAVVATLPQPGGPLGAAISPDGTRLYVANFEDSTLSTIDTQTTHVLRTTPQPARPQEIALSPDGQRAYVTQSTVPGFVAVVDTTNGVVVDTLEVGLYIPNPVAISADGNLVYVGVRASFDERNPCNAVCKLPVFVFDLSRNKFIVGEPLISAPHYSLALSPLGDRAYVGGSLHLSVMGATIDFRLVTEIPGVLGGSIAVHPSNDRAYAAGANLVAVIDTVAISVLNTIDLPPAFTLTGMAITPDGTRLYVSAGDFNEQRRSPSDVVYVIDTASEVIVGHIDVSPGPGKVVIGPLGPPFTPQPTPTPTATPSPTIDPTPSPTSIACTGDCGGDGRVSIDELVTAVNIALGQASASACLAADVDHDGHVTIDELVRAVDASLVGCP